MRRRELVALAVFSILALMTTGAGAAVFNDDPGNNTTSVFTNTKSDPAVPGCDTLDPVTTQNALVVGYKCINHLSDATNKGILNLTSFEFTATGGTITLKWTTQGNFPTAIDPASGVGEGYSVQVWFKNANRQNARQTVGDTLDCTRYAHMGPYLTGNNEYLVIYSGAVLTETGFEVDQGWGHFDPMTNSIWAFLPDGTGTKCGGCINGMATHCDGLNRVQHAWTGTGMTTTISGNTITTTLPYTFRWVDNQSNELKYDLIAPGDIITAIVPTAGGNIDAATTPPLAVHTNPPCVDVGELTPDCSGEPTLSQSKQGVSLTTLLDWMPWAGIDLGILPNPSGISEIPSALCPAYHALEYTPGGAKNNVGGTYSPLPKGPLGEDRETQSNPFFGLNHYDSNGASGTTTNDLVSQNHTGTTTCTSPVPAVFRFTSTGGSLTAS